MPSGVVWAGMPNPMTMSLAAGGLSPRSTSLRSNRSRFADASGICGLPSRRTPKSILFYSNPYYNEFLCAWQVFILCIQKKTVIMGMHPAVWTVLGSTGLLFRQTLTKERTHYDKI